MNTPQFKSPALKNFDPNGYHFFGLWKQNLFSACFWTSCWNKEIIEKFGLTAQESGVLVLTEGNFFLKKSEIKNIKEQIQKKIEGKDEAFFKNLVKVADEYFTSAIAYSNTLKDKKLTPEDFWEFVTEARKVNFIWMLGAEQFSEAAQEKLSSVAVEEGFPSEKLSEIIPKFDTPLNQQHREVVELKKMVGDKPLTEIKKDLPLFAKLEDHAKRFAWIEIANLTGETLTVERLYEQIIHAKSEHMAEVKGDYSISQRLAFHALCLSYCGYIRQAGAEYFFMLTEKALPYLRSIAQKFDLTYTEFLLQRDVDILEALKGNITIQDLKNNVEQREKMNMAMFAGIGTDVNFVDEAQDIEILKQLMIPRADKENKEIKGQIGNKGKYTGPVRVIMNTYDFPKMQTGDVLVSTMTTPDFVVLMHKAGAIVTDIGGLLCHAAIVSREINKPCVIGTKFATQILKDGDMVEVDAEKGIVKILK
jgi:phosphoenolpyruvate synthase/pyruvate phosphate dikinase